jgi:arylsulfatase A-like enzyme
MKIIILIATLLLTANNALAGANQSITVILVDDMRVDDVQYVPSLSQLATNGVSFSGAVTPYPLCTPSRVSLLTGQSPEHHGVFTNYISHADLSDTLATRLHTQGYRTGIFGKLGNRSAELSTQPPGWDQYYVLHQHRDLGRRQPLILAREAVNFIEQCVADDVPCFTYLAPAAPHGPNWGPEMCTPPYPPMPAGLFAPEELWNRRMSSLCGVDEMIKRVRHALPEGSTVIFLGDNGFALEEYKTGKNELLLEASRVPMIIQRPGVTAGVTRGEVVTLMDVTATILSVAGANTGGIDGHSVEPLLLGSTDSWYGAVTLMAVPADEEE